MKKNKKEKIVYEKIEIDEKTSEPIIVDVPIKDVSDVFKKEEPLPPPHEDMESAGNQLIMNKVFGLDSAPEKDSVSKRQALFKKITSWVFVLFVGIVLGVTVYNDFFSGKKELLSFTEMMSVLRNNIQYFVYSIFALIICYLLKGFKLSFFCKRETGKWHFKTCLGTAAIGHYYNYITPLAVGGQPFEIYHLSKNGVHGGVAASLPIASFFLQQFAFVLLAIASLIMYNTNVLNAPQTLRFFPAGLTVLAIVGIVCCFTVPFLVVLFCIFPRISYKIVYFVIWLGSKIGLVKDRRTLNYKMTKSILQNSKSLKSFVSNPFVLIVSLLISLGENLALCSIAYFSLKFFGYNLVGVDGIMEWAQVCVVCMLLYSAISFIPTPGNSGAADLSFYLLFESGLATIGNVAFPALMTWRFMSFYSFIIIGFIFTKVNKAKELKRSKKL